MIQGYAPDHELSESEYYAKVRDPTFTAPELQAPPESWQKIYFGEFLPRVLIVDRYKRDNALMLAIALASIQMDYMLENRPYWRAEG